MLSDYDDVPGFIIALSHSKKQQVNSRLHPLIYGVFTWKALLYCLSGCIERDQS